MMSDMIERVALAISSVKMDVHTYHNEPDLMVVLDMMSEHNLNQAKAAIEAMIPQIPDGRFFEVMDNAMLDAGIKEFEQWRDPTDPGALVGAFKAMLTAALKELPEPPKEKP